MKAERLLPLLLIGMTAVAAQTGKYALVIGITGYPNFRENDRLRYADADARSFAEWLQTDSAGSFKPEDIRLLVNERATRVSIYDAIRWIGSKATSDDLVYVFFAGHGVSDDSGRAYFMPYDGSPLNPNALGMRADSFMQDLKESISARQMIFFFDACHAAAAYSRAGLERRDAGNIAPQIRQLWQGTLANLQEINMGFMSASSNEFSIEDDMLKHGIFTWYLLKGLRGDADANGDRRVTAGELRAYLSRTVDEHARRNNAQQTPNFSPAFDGSRVLAFTTPGTRGPLGDIQGVELTPISKSPPPQPRTIVRFTPRARSTFRATVEGQDRYNFDVWVDIDPADAGRVVKVVYDFVLTSNPLHMESTQSRNGFSVPYEGWGCYGQVKAAFYLKNPTEVYEAPPFNECEVLRK